MVYNHYKDALVAALTLSVCILNVNVLGIKNLLPEDCGYIDIDEKILQGENADLNEFPWMARFLYKTLSGYDYQCAGTVINDEWILTAAHCIPSTKNLVSIRVGEYNTTSKKDCMVQGNGVTKCSEPVQDLSIKRIVSHPNYSSKVLNDDIALVQVSKINLSVENVKPICLPRNTNQSFTKAIVTGWGRTETGERSTILLKLTLPIVDLKQCKLMYKENSKIQLTDKQICAGGEADKDSCGGDSGGPLQAASYLNNDIRYVQQGIVSYGPKQCGLEGSPGIYTKVSSYMDWILSTITSK